MLSVTYTLQNEKGVKDTGNLQKIRKDRRLSQEQLAAMSGVSRVQIARIEAGRTNPTAQTLKKLSTALACSVGELIGG